MRRATCRILALYGLGAVAVLIPLVAASWLAGQRSLEQEEARATAIAEQLLHRADRITEQLSRVLTELNDAPVGDSCSERNINAMRALVIRSNLLIDVGHVSGDTFECSAFGRDPVAVGPQTYISRNGYRVWVGTHHPLAPDTRLIIVADPRTGFAGVVSQELLIDMVSNEPGL